MPSPTSRRKKSPARAGAHTGQAARLGLGGNKLLVAQTLAHPCIALSRFITMFFDRAQYGDHVSRWTPPPTPAQLFQDHADISSAEKRSTSSSRTPAISRAASRNIRLEGLPSAGSISYRGASAAVRNPSPKRKLTPKAREISLLRATLAASNLRAAARSCIKSKFRIGENRWIKATCANEPHRRRRTTKPRPGIVRIAISQAAFDAIAKTLPLGSVGYENKVNEKGERLIWLEPASGASVDQVDCLVRTDIDIGHIRRLTVGVFPAQIHVTILALRYFSPRPLAGIQRV